MNTQNINENVVAIYLDVASNAVACQQNTSVKMLRAAFELVENACYIADLNQIVRIGELSLIVKQVDQAERIFTAALRVSRRKRSTEDWLLARINDGLSEVYLAQEQFDKAKRKIEQTIKIMMKIPDINKNLIQQRMRRLALLQYQLGENHKADDILARLKSNAS